MIFEDEEDFFSITEFIAENKEAERADKLLASLLPEYSRSYIKSLIDEGLVLVNGRVIKAGTKIASGMRLTIKIPPPKEMEILPEKMDLDIIYEDEDVLLVNKPKNMVVHPSAGHYGGTLVNGLMYYLKDRLSGINGELRPGIVHRIDKDTTGLLVICKNDNAHRFIADQLKEHSITRKYFALVHGLFKEEEGRVDAPIGRHPTDRKKMAIVSKNGKRAVTHYKVLKQFILKNKATYSLLECRLETGRTHQIRVHLTSLGHPLVGDAVYGNGKNPFHLEGQALHAASLGFIHPTKQVYMEWEADLPDEYKELLQRLQNMSR